MRFDPYTIKTLISKHGQTTTFVSRTAEGTYDPATGSNSAGTTTSYTVTGYFYNYALEEIDGNDIIRGDRKLLLSTIDTSGTAIPEPSTGDSFTGVGDTVVVMYTSKIFSGNQVMCYVCQVRE
tara:strand:- start:1325 stop:1693 length:369 start_codon:yes stop_codon:yes gene_type:complete